MAAFLADSSVLLDVFTADPTWSEWSLNQLDAARAEGVIHINPVIYSEISVRFSRIEDLEATLNESRLVWSEIPREALFLAAKAFLAYRKAGGSRTTPLPDFFIGAHAAVSDLVLITRDPERVRRYFPKLSVRCP
jgi:predicted nucleic acid-binding protein